MTTDTLISEYEWWYGRDEPPIAPRQLRAGPVTASLVGRDLRNIRYGGIEVAQRMYMALRDRNWDTVPGEVSDVIVEQGDDSFAVRFTVTHRQRDIDLTWQGEVVGQPNGVVSYAMDATAGADMTYKLIGLNVHHGMREYAGRPCRGVTPDGPIVDAFSVEIAPQLIADETEVPIFPPVESLTVDLTDDVTVRFDYEGDTFEFEDQRNWTDASFKSQSYPPRRGGFNTIRRGQRVWQKVTITPSGTPPAAAEEDGEILITVGESIARRLPPVGFGMPSHDRGHSKRETELLSALRPDHLRVEVQLGDATYPEQLARAIEAATALKCGLELALHLTGDANAQLLDLASRIGGTRVDRVLVFHQSELATDPSWVELARQRLRDAAPDALFAGGTNANFCELNRFRSAGAPEDGIVYSINPQIHAFDELSLAENIAGQTETVQTARTYGGGRPVVVSPVTLKQRFNAVATTAEPEPAPGELPPQVDPRQMSLFASAWTVGSLSTLLESEVASATYVETTGWRGVIQGDEAPSAPDKFPSRAGMVFPLYHVFADLAEWKNGRVVRSRSSNPLAVESLALEDDAALHLLLANLTPRPRTVTIDSLSGREISVRRLNATTAEDAALDPEHFRTHGEVIVPKGPPTLTLAPFEVVRIDAPKVRT
jgi:hypothetical protein